MLTNKFEKVHVKNRTCYHFDDIIKLEDSDIDNTYININININNRL